VWLLFFIISFFCFLISALLAVFSNKIRCKNIRVFSPSKILFFGVVIASVILFFPIYLYTFENNNCGVFETILISIHNTIRLFVVDGEFTFITSNLVGVSSVLSKAYSVLFAIYFLLAPLLTFNFILSFFSNFTAYERYFIHYFSDVFVFSELNEKSVALAKSIRQNNPRCFIIFTNVAIESELLKNARELDAVCFERDIASISFGFHSKRKSISFFTISDDQSLNVVNALEIINKYRFRDNTDLYVFSSKCEAELQLSTAFNGNNNSKIKVRRINTSVSLVYKTLYDEGYEKIFKSAFENNNKVKEINVLIIGLGSIGTEMLKALTWYCQMNGYELTINAFDQNPNADKIFKSLCPELMDEEHNGNFKVLDEAKYNICITPNIDVFTVDFDEKLKSINNPTYAFVALGDDDKNISVSIKLRSLFARYGAYPIIQAVTESYDSATALSNISNFKGQKFNIDFIGDTATVFSNNVILNSELEKTALLRHLKWGKETEFWQYDYNYKSSMASVIHHKLKKLCNVSGIEKLPENRSEVELYNLRVLEHCRWNAYMRTEGYSYSGSISSDSRNDLAKLHNCLVAFSQLPIEEQIKDDN